MSNNQSELRDDGTLTETLWGRALDMTSDDFSNEADYLTAKENYKKYCLKEMRTLIEDRERATQERLLDELEEYIDTENIVMQGNKMLYQANVHAFIIGARQALGEEQ